MTHHCSVPEVRRISTLASAPFFNSSDASQPESLITAPTNWLKLGLCPTTMIASWLEYFSSSLRKSARPACGTQSRRRPAIFLRSPIRCRPKTPSACSASAGWKRSHPLERLTPRGRGRRSRTAQCPLCRERVFRLFSDWRGARPRLRAQKIEDHLRLSFLSRHHSCFTPSRRTSAGTEARGFPSATLIRKSCALNAADPVGGRRFRAPRTGCHARM